MCVCVCVCVCERERERERETSFIPKGASAKYGVRLARARWPVCLVCLSSLCRARALALSLNLALSLSLSRMSRVFDDIKLSLSLFFTNARARFQLYIMASID